MNPITEKIGQAIPMDQEISADQTNAVEQNDFTGGMDITKQESTTDQVLELKQSFLLAAITDVSSYIHLTDTKVSIIMGAVVALIAGILSCYDAIYNILNQICPCSCKGVVLIIDAIIWSVSLIYIFVFGLLTVRGHSSKLDYPSKWYLSDARYSFDKYIVNLKTMTDSDVLENIAAELYKLNDINRQKSFTLRWTLRSFAISLVTLGVFAFTVLFVK